MKSRKGLMQILIMMVVILAGLSIATISNAAMYVPARTLKQSDIIYRALYNPSNHDWVPKYAYKATILGEDGTPSNALNEGLNMWKIYEYNGTRIQNYNNAIYCIKMGTGFGTYGYHFNG